MGFPHELEMDKDLIRLESECFRDALVIPDFYLCRTADEVYRFYHDVAWNYSGFLHKSLGFSWTSAFFLKEQLEDYWLDVPKGKKAREPFQFDEDRLNSHIARRCRQFISLDGVKATALLQAVWLFAEYLCAHGQIEGETFEHVRRISSQLFERCRKAVDSTDPVQRLISEFPNFKIVDKKNP
jgi:hypothetical protein